MLASTYLFPFSTELKYPFKDLIGFIRRASICSAATVEVIIGVVEFFKSSAEKDMLSGFRQTLLYNWECYTRKIRVENLTYVVGCLSGSNLKNLNKLG